MVVANSTVTVVFVAPERTAVSVTVALVSAVLMTLVVKLTVLPSLSEMVSTLVARLMRASVGLLRTMRKVSFVSCVSSSVIARVKVLFVSPAAKLRVAFVAE